MTQADTKSSKPGNIISKQRRGLMGRYRAQELRSRNSRLEDESSNKGIRQEITEQPSDNTGGE